MATSAAAAAASEKTRKILLAKVHIAKKQFGADAYEGALMQFAGVTSAKHCSVPQLRLVISHFEKSGFNTQARRPGQTGKPRRADHAVARKARVMWISLAHLCAINTLPQVAIRDDKALEHFATRQLGCERLQWANQNQADKLIEALKSMAARHGWDQSHGKLSKATYVHALKVRLCDAILAKLVRAGLAGEGWTLNEAAFRLVGIEPDGIHFTTQEYERMAAALGGHLRDHGGPGAFEAMKS